MTAEALLERLDRRQAYRLVWDPEACRWTVTPEADRRDWRALSAERYGIPTRREVRS